MGQAFVKKMAKHYSAIVAGNKTTKTCPGLLTRSRDADDEDDGPQQQQQQQQQQRQQQQQEDPELPQFREQLRRQRGGSSTTGTQRKAVIPRPVSRFLSLTLVFSGAAGRAQAAEVHR